MEDTIADELQWFDAEDAELLIGEQLQHKGHLEFLAFPQTQEHVFVVQCIGDFLVGFYMDKHDNDTYANIILKSSNPPHLFDSMRIEPGQFRYAVEDNRVLFLNTRRFDIVRIECKDVKFTIHLVYARIRSFLQTFPFVPLPCIPDYDDDNEHNRHLGPLLKTKEEFIKERALITKSRLSVFRKELMERTWHPSRFRKWCLTHDDEFFLCSY